MAVSPYEVEIPLMSVPHGPVRRQSYDWLSTLRRYQIILLGNRGTCMCVNDFPRIAAQMRYNHNHNKRTCIAHAVKEFLER